VAAAGQACRSLSLCAAGTDLPLVHRGLRHGGSASGQGTAGGAASIMRSTRPISLVRGRLG
jgi:hypothetical protein